MLRNLNRFLGTAAVLLLAAAPALRAQSGGGTPLRGDVDGDGRVTAADARIIADYLVGRAAPAGVNVAERGDVNGDGRVTSVDAAIVSAYVAGRDMSRYGVGRPEPQFPNALQKLVCRGDLRAKTVSCDDPLAPPAGGPSRLLVGGQNLYVKLASTAPSYNAGTGDFSFGVTVQNLVAQTLGTTDGTTSDVDSVRVFFSQKPTPTGAGDTGSMDVSNANGLATYTAANQPYIQYPGFLTSGSTSVSRTWHFQVTGTVTQFQFTVYVAAAVAFPNGWIDVYPPNHSPSPYNVYADTVSAGQTLQLTDSVRNAVGKVVPGAAVSWTSTGHGAATVNASSGLVSAAADGVDTVTASSGGRTGRVVIFVSTASAAHSTITALPTSIVAGDSSAITVQLRDASNNNITHSAGTVALGATGGTVTAVTDNNNGTYSAKYTHTTAGTYRVFGTLNGTAIGDSATVTVTAGAADSLFVHAANPQTGTAGLPAGSPPGVLVTDKYHNPVQGINIRFGVTSGGGKLSNGGPAADSVDVVTGSNGIATVTSWTLGNTSGTNNNTVVAHATAVTLAPTSVTFTASADPGPPANMVKSAGDGQSATVNTNVATAPAVTITDSHGNPVPGVTVHFAVASGGGSVGAPDSSITNASGVATVTSWKLGTTAGSNTLNATSTGLTTVTFTATGTADVPANITKTSTDPQSGTVGSAVASAPAVHVTDQYGNAVPNVTVNFSVTGGGGSTTGAAPTTNASGNAAVGSWTLGGTAPFPNTLSATASGGSNPSTTFTAYVPPVATTDSSQAMGNTTLSSTVAPNVLTNDVGRNGTALSITTTGALTTVRGGTLTLAANGTFSYLPAAGITGRDSVQYTIDDTHATASGFIKLRFVGKVWYIDSSGANGDGRDISPFSSVANAEASAGVNDTMLVRTGGATTGGGTLKNGQTLRGQGQNAAFTTTLNGSSVTLLTSGGTPPNVGALTLASGNSLRGFRVFNASGGGLVGASIGTLSIGEMSIGVTGGAAIDISNGTITGNGGTGAAVFDSVRSTNSSSVGISLNAVAGTLTVNGGTASSITGPTGVAVSINGSNPTFSFPGPISKTNGAGTGISLTSMTGGSATFSGPSVVLSTGSSAGINMSSSSATVSFVDSVKVTTGSGNGVSATSGGTLSIAGTHNSISSSGGIALNVSSTTIGAAGLNFRSISATGGSNGIVLSNTGTTAGLTVTGDGSTNGSGGTIQSQTGADFAQAGNGIYLNNARNISLSWMAISNTNNSGIYGSAVRGSFFVNHVRITGTIGTQPSSGAPRESPIHLEDVGGAVKVQNSRLDGSAWDGFLADNTAGTAPVLDSLVLVNDSVTTMQGSAANVFANGGLQAIIGDGTADVRIRNNFVTAWFSAGIQVIAQSTGTATTRITSNFVDNQNGALAGAQGIEVSGGQHSFNISSNTVRHTNGTAISSDRTAAGSLMNGTIDGNAIGVSGDANSGSATGIGIFASQHGPNTTTVKISNNTLRQINGSANGAINTVSGDALAYGGSGTLNATVTGNNIQETGTTPNSAQSGILVTHGTQSGPPNDTDNGCYDINSNTIANFNTSTPSHMNLIRVNQRFGTTSRWPGYTGAATGTTSQTDMGTYLLGRNTASTSVNANTSTGGFLNTSPAGSACPQPSM